MIQLSVSRPAPLLCLILSLWKQKKCPYESDQFYFRAKVPSQYLSLAGIPVPSASLWKWVRLGVWVGRWICRSTGWAGVRGARKWDAGSLYTFPVFRIHSTAWVPVRKQKWRTTRACSRTILRATTYQPLNSSHNCHHTPQMSLTLPLVNSVCFQVVWMLSPLPYRDSDIPAPENKGKRQAVFLPSLALFTSSQSTCWATCVCVVVFLYSDCAVSLLWFPFFYI